MKIRTRIMLLYLALSAFLLAVLLPVVYSSVASSLKRSTESELQIEASKYIAALEIEEDTLSFSSAADIDISRGVVIGVYNGGELTYTSGTNSLFEILTAKPESESGTATSNFNGQTWMIVWQELPLEEDAVYVAAACSMAAMEDSLNDLCLLLLALVPLFLGISAAGAALLAGRALRPISQITKTAMQIGAGDLSLRIPQLETKDEVGELAAAFNQMLDNVEDSFKRERQFSSDASHELRTPVAIIFACAEDALTRPQTPETQEDLLSIQKESARMSRIISQLLTLTRGYEGRFHVEKEQLSLCDITVSVLDELAAQADEAQITLCNQVPEKLFVFADQSLLTVLLVNLVGNAIKYGRQGGHVWVSAEQKTNFTELRVRDDGIGISTDDMSHVFERFYRADKARDRSGSGLGLAIAKWIVELHGGTIDASSSCGHGSIFTISLPVPYKVPVFQSSLQAL